MGELKIKEYKVEDIEHYLCIINFFYKNSGCPSIWFRGEPKDYGNSSLTPSLLRQNFWGLLKKDSEQNDFNIEFLRNFHIFYQEIINTSWFFSDFNEVINLQSLAIVRHYGVKTPLLDFSTSSLVALYFAVNESPQDDGIVYVLNPCLLNFQKTFGKYLGLIATEEDFNTKVRLNLPRIIFKEEAKIGEEIPPHLEFFNIKKALRTFNEFDNTLQDKSKSYSINFILSSSYLKKQDCLKAFKERLRKNYKQVEMHAINVDLYTTPIAVLFKYSMPYMTAQEAVGILFGFTWLKDSKKQSFKFLGFRSLIDFIKNYFPDCMWEDILIKIRINKCKKQKFLKSLQELGLNNFEIFGKDLRFVEDKAYRKLNTIDNQNFR